MTQKRFGDLTVLKLWIVPAAVFWLCAVGFLCGVIAEKSSDPNKPLIPGNVSVLGVPSHGVQGAVAIAIYNSWLFGLAVVDAERKRVPKERDSAPS